MKLTARAALFLVVSLVAACVAQAQSSPFYITNGDAHLLFVVQNGALQATYTTPSTPLFDANKYLPYPLAVTSSILLAGRDNDGGVEMTLEGVLTGNTFPSTGGHTELLDGTTDGVHNYTGVDNEMIVLRTDPHWQNAEQIFAVPFEPVGIAYDTKRRHLFLTDFESNIYEYDLTGNQIHAFDVSAAIGSVSLASLAYEGSTDTLWTCPNGSGTIYQFSPSGQLLKTLEIPNFDPGNNYGGEMQLQFGATQGAPAVGPVGLVVIGFALAIFGIVALASGQRSHTRRA